MARGREGSGRNQPPAIGPAAWTLARLYDLRFDSRNRDFMLYASPADLAISSFGGRQEHYERFYGGDADALRSMFWYNQFDWSEPMRLVDECLASFSVRDVLDEMGSEGGT